MSKKNQPVSIEVEHLTELLNQSTTRQPDYVGTMTHITYSILARLRALAKQDTLANNMPVAEYINDIIQLHYTYAMSRGIVFTLTDAGIEELWRTLRSHERNSYIYFINQALVELKLAYKEDWVNVIRHLALAYSTEGYRYMVTRTEDRYLYNRLSNMEELEIRLQNNEWVAVILLISMVGVLA